MEKACWILGCTNMTASLVMSTIGFHKKSLDDATRKAIERSVNVHQVASVGFLLLAYQKGPLIPSVLLMAATFLFPYVIYFEKLTAIETPLKRFVPMGGFMHMVFWIMMAFYYTPSDQLIHKSQD